VKPYSVCAENEVSASTADVKTSSRGHGSAENGSCHSVAHAPAGSCCFFFSASLVF